MWIVIFAIITFEIYALHKSKAEKCSGKWALHNFTPAACTISLHPITEKKSKIPLKKNWVHIKLHFRSLFQNNLFRIILSKMYYFNFGFFIQNGILIFFSRFLYPEAQKSLPDLFFQNALFSFLDFISEIKSIFGFFEIMLGAGSICLLHR